MRKQLQETVMSLVTHARKSPVAPLLIICAALAIMLIPAACRSREAISAPVIPHEDIAISQVTPNVPTPLPSSVVPRSRTLPTLATEPTINVLLQSSTRIDITLLVSGHIGQTPIAAGVFSAEAAPGHIRLNGVDFPSDFTVELSEANGSARFSAELTPPFGKPQHLRFAGTPILRLDSSGRVQLIERIALESYLAGVVPTEMSPSWPLEALKAQAVAARSYAAAHYLERAGQPWHLHWHYSVDMAYAGVSAHVNPIVQQALSETRGWILEYHGQPVPALFHACSGGRTESATDLFPSMRSSDGMSITPAMPSVIDEAAHGGAAALKMLDTHWLWKANIPLTDVTNGLAEWTRDHPDARLTFGTVLEVRPAGKFAESERVATVAIRHRLAKKEVTTIMPAQDFRMAVGPGIVRSTWWDRCVTAGTKNGTLVLTGRGFGHGVGLSQVSAWKMAHDGQRAEAILGTFYPGDVIVRKWP